MDKKEVLKIAIRYVFARQFLFNGLTLQSLSKKKPAAACFKNL
jgi:hypothetical protein